ncbi:mercuric transporter MerT family protein [Alteromonas oceanisediminis]|uniref:mercuric transporter MerT family protein n=1 Tax=Alteromonas oceanisediminis TaxID=2836180 RepID=UPI001BD98733|nr:mercuric transporter MerT family protein [Alteromonas oceanisediminis]MBT0587030.1 mercury transporter [Alteromonas oceanisediminis]
MAKSSELSIVGGLAAAIGASACCAGPLVLLLLGISGTWISHLTLMGPYRSLFIFVVVVLFGFAGWKIYQPVENCQDVEACAAPKVRTRRKAVFWFTTMLALVLITSNYWIIWVV